MPRRAQGVGVTVAALQGAEVAGGAVLHEGDTPVALVQEVARGADPHLVVQEAHLHGRPFRAVVPDLDHRQVRLGQEFLRAWAVEVAGDHQGRR
ncbi:hypothetical protein D9M69_518850 [compost metagenome]